VSDIQSDIHIQKITDPLIVVSDIHLLDEEDERGQKLLALLREIDPSAVRHLVLLGDIFDFCFGASRYFHRKFAQIGQELIRLSQQGTEVHFIQGNHEFALENLPWPGVGLTTATSRVIRLGNTTIAFTHGDVLGAPWHYHWYRRFSRSALFKTAGLALPHAFLDRLALGISRKSRKQGMTRKIDHRRIISHMRAWYGQQGCDHGIVGHFHIPYHLQEVRGEILCLESWDSPNYLAFREGKFSRVYL
jgi:UDP-2,3-diacylglucosamine hydrolase